MPVEVLLWPYSRDLKEGFSAGAGNETMADSSYTQEMLQNVMVAPLAPNDEFHDLLFQISRNEEELKIERQHEEQNDLP